MIVDVVDADIYVVHQLDDADVLIVWCIVFVVLTLALSENTCHMPALLDLLASLNSLVILGFACIDSDRDVDACCPLAIRLLELWML